MKKITTIEYIFDQKEKNLIKVCLDYCFHRIDSHAESAISRLVKKEDLNKIREELK